MIDENGFMHQPLVPVSEHEASTVRARVRAWASSQRDAVEAEHEVLHLLGLDEAGVALLMTVSRR